jgi:acyl-CoA synthetase (NDP forming)
MRLEKFFNPRAIAVIGASEQGLYPAGILRNLIEFGFPGPVYPVNPNQKHIFGMEAYPSIEQTPGPVDLAIVVVNRSRVLPVVAQCAAVGVQAVLIITAGFAESDAEGVQLQAQLADLIKSSELAVLGPNCAGYAGLRGRLVATRLPCPAQIGGVSFISQSGALMMALYGVFIDHCLGLNKIISVGNQVDIDLGTGLTYLAQDPETHVIGAFVEGVKDGASLVGAMQAALQNGKPLVLVKSGRTGSGQKAAATHTAAVAGSDFVFQSVCRQFGVHLAADIREMVDVLRVQAAFGDRLMNFERWMVVTQSGGMGSLAADAIENAGMFLNPPGVGLQQALRSVEHLSAIIHWENPADVRGASLRGSATQKTLRPFLEDAENDLVLLLLARSLVQSADEETAQAICQVVRETDKPLVVVWVGQHISVDQPARLSADQLLTQAGIPVFPQVSDAVQALNAARQYWLSRQLALQHAEIHGGVQP